MQRTTRTRILQEGHPLAATTSAPRAKGNAKIVCEKRISRRKRATGPSSDCVMIIDRAGIGSEYADTIAWLKNHFREPTTLIPRGSPGNVCSSGALAHAWFVLSQSFRLRRSRHRTLRDFWARGTCTLLHVRGECALRACRQIRPLVVWRSPAATPVDRQDRRLRWRK